MIDPEQRQAGDLARFRGYLYVLATRHTGPRLRAKVDASDVVQQTLVQALAALRQYRGTSDAELAAWLRQILARQLSNAARDLGRQKRDMMRQRSLEAALDQSASRLEVFLAAADSSPSQKAQRNEQCLRMAAALAELPEAQRDAIVLHQFPDNGRQVVIPGDTAPSATAFSPDGRQLAIGYRDGSVRLCHVNSGEEIFQCRLKSRPITQLAFGGDGATLAVTDGNDGVQLLDLPGLRRDLTSIRLDW
jgi:RNA polymerase sigma-70 factor (ECF subfamily)